MFSTTNSVNLINQKKAQPSIPDKILWPCDEPDYSNVSKVPADLVTTTADEIMETIIETTATTTTHSEYRVTLTKEEIMEYVSAGSLRFLGTEDDLGRLFFRYLGDTIKILPGNDVVYHWNGTRWSEVTSFVIDDLYWSFIDNLVELVPEFRLPLSQDFEKLIHSAKKMSTKRAIIARAYESSALRTQASDWNQHTHLVGVANGVFNAQTGKLIPNKMEYKITQYSAFKYTPGLKADFYRKFMNDIFQGDNDLIEYVERALGYSATGSTAHQVMFYCYGGGANGKTALMSLAELILGESVGVIPVENLLEIQPGPRPFLFKNRAKRMVITNEVPESRYINESAVKQMTGGDTLEVRDLHRSPVRVTTQWSCWITGNYLPRVQGRDEGFWRRVQVIPFNAFIAKENRMSSEKMRALFEREGDAILTTWLDAAHRLYTENEFNNCQAVKGATDLYKTGEDTFGAFLTECCDTTKGAKESKRLLFDAWVEYNGTEQTSIKSINMLTKEILRRGYTVGGNANAYYIGLALKD